MSYILRKSPKEAGKVEIENKNTKTCATFYNGKLNKITIDGAKMLYPDGVNPTSIELKDGKTSVYFDENNQKHVTIEGKEVASSSPAYKAAVREADKLTIKGDAYLKEIATNPHFREKRCEHLFDNKMVAWADNAKNRLNNKVAIKTDKNAIKTSGARGATADNDHTIDPNIDVALGKSPERKAYEGKAQTNTSKIAAKTSGSRGATATEGHTADPNTDVALGKTPERRAYENKGKAPKTSTPNKSEKVTTRNMDAVVQNILEKAKNMTEDDVRKEFDKQYGKGSYDKYMEAKKQAVAATEMAKQKRRSR